MRHPSDRRRIDFPSGLCALSGYRVVGAICFKASLRHAAEWGWENGEDCGKVTGDARLLVAIVLRLGGPATAAAPDNALQFDGTNDYVTFGQATSTLGATQFTLETWFKRAGTSGDSMGTGTGWADERAPARDEGLRRGRDACEPEHELLPRSRRGNEQARRRLRGHRERRQPSGLAGHRHARGHSGRLASRGRDLRRHDLADLPRRQARPEQSWSGASRPSRPRSSTPRSPARSSRPASTACSSGNPGFFQGQLDEARIWNVARTGAQIRANKNSETPAPTTGLIGRTGASTRAPARPPADSSGQGVTGTLTNGPRLGRRLHVPAGRERAGVRCRTSPRPRGTRRST